MAKQITIIEIQEEINNLNISKSESIDKITELEKLNVIETKNYIINLREDSIYEEEKNIEKFNLNIQKLEYQISVGGRKLKTNISISKDLVNAGFVKAQFEKGICGGFACTTGDFKVIDNTTEVIVSFGIYSKEKIINYLIKKYGDDAKIEGSKIIIKK